MKKVLRFSFSLKNHVHRIFYIDDFENENSFMIYASSILK